MPDVSRRGFMARVPAATWGVVAASSTAIAGVPSPVPAGQEVPALPPGFPRVDGALVRGFVGLCHRDVVEVTRMVERQPSLARSSWDWGFGDWETALGAASHTGRRNIAEVLFAHGARPTIFSAAMMGQLDIVRAFVTTSPGMQSTLGPHGITLLRHAIAGKDDAAAVVTYLERVGGADVGPATRPLADADRAAIVGRYVYGPGEDEHFDMDVRNDRLELKHGGSARFVYHVGDLVFFPSGVPTVKIAFAREGGSVTRLTVADPDVFLTAARR
jgi:hypothetical protein